MQDNREHKTIFTTHRHNPPKSFPIFVNLPHSHSRCRPWLCAQVPRRVCVCACVRARVRACELSCVHAACMRSRPCACGADADLAQPVLAAADGSFVQVAEILIYSSPACRIHPTSIPSRPPHARVRENAHARRKGAKRLRGQTSWAGKKNPGHFEGLDPRKS